MDKIKSYDIPKDIHQIELGSEISKFNALENLVPQFRSNNETYFELLSAMIHLEEAANSKHMQKFSLEQVQLVNLLEMRNTFAVALDVCIMIVFI